MIKQKHNEEEYLIIIYFIADAYNLNNNCNRVFE